MSPPPSWRNQRLTEYWLHDGKSSPVPALTSDELPKNSSAPPLNRPVCSHEQLVATPSQPLVDSSSTTPFTRFDENA